MTESFNEITEQITSVVMQIAVGATSQEDDIQEGVNSIAKLSDMLITGQDNIQNVARFTDSVEKLKNERIEVTSHLATEIRRLSEQADTFTQEIQMTIDNLGDTTSISVEMMNSMTKSIETQTDGISLTYEKIKGIADAIEILNEGVERLLGIQGQMSIQRDEMIHTMHELSAIAQENAASTEEVVSSVKEQSISVGQIYTSVKVIRNLAQKLQEQVEKFVI